MTAEEVLSQTGPVGAGSEYRRTPRRAFHRLVGILRGGRYEVFRALQLSEGGILFKAEASFAISEQIVASVIVPSGGVVSARGQIIYERPSDELSREYGVKFAPLGLHARRWIRIYIAAKTQKEAENDLSVGFTDDALVKPAA